VTAAGILQTEYTEAEAKAWAALPDVESYAVFLDLTADPGTIRSSSRIRFRCRERDAATFADLRVHGAVRVADLRAAVVRRGNLGCGDPSQA
jgi:hypothetical protein